MNALANPLIVADTHNVLNTGTSWTDPDTWVTRLGNAGKFIATSALSGANSFYNTAASVGKWAGLGTEEVDPARFISSIDSDLGAYYRANKELTDITGFVLGSLVPGLAGVKLFNAGQTYLRGAIETGKITGAMAQATGLLVTNKAKYLDEAASTIKSSLASQGVMNTATYKALASGVYQNVLEATAAEIVIATTMFKSPVLDDMSAWGLTKNIATGALLGGAIGGAISGAQSVGFLRKVMRAEDSARMPWMRDPTFASAVEPSNKIITLADDLENTAFPIRVQTPEGATAVELKALDGQYKVTRDLFESKISRAQDVIRTEFHKLADKDTQLGNLVADISMPVRLADGQIQPGYSQGVLENLSGAARISRVTEETAIEKAVRRATESGNADAEGVPAIGVRFVKLHGEDMGAVSDSLPPVLSLGDLYGTKKAILDKVRTYNFSTKSLWDATKLTGERAHLDAELRYVWASNPNLKFKPAQEIHATDIPLLERAYRDNNLDIRIISGEGPTLDIFTPTTKQELFERIRDAKIDVAENFLLREGYQKAKRDTNAVADQAARIANVRRSYLEGTHSPVEAEDLFASESARVKWLSERQKRGLSLSNEEATDLAYLPSYAKVVYRLDKNVLDSHEYIGDAMVALRQQQQVAVEANKRVVAKWAGNYFDQLPDYSPRELARLNRDDPSAGFLTGANSGYGTPGATSTQIGKITSELLQSRTKEVSEEMTAVLAPLAGKMQAAFEFEAASRFVQRSGKQFVLRNLGDSDAPLWGLMERKTALALDEGKIEFDEATAEKVWFKLKHRETVDAAEAHISAAGRRTEMMQEIRAAQGKSDEKFTDVFRPIYRDPKDYPYFAFVYDARITNAGHKAMIHAASEKELAELIDRVPTHLTVTLDEGLASRIKVRTKVDVENYARARQEYEFSRTLHENYIDSELASAGVYSDYFPKSDPGKIVNDVLQQHLRETRMSVRELVSLRYEPEFAMFEQMGKEYSRFATSKFASRSDLIEKTSDNPYFNQIKTALNISNIGEHPLWEGFNRILDTAVSKAYGALTKMQGTIKSEAELVKINDLLDRQGLKPAYYDSALQALANHQAPKGVLTDFVRKANSMLSTVTLGLDPLNAVNNAIGSNILRMTELQSVLRAIRNGNSELAGDLADLAKIQLPGVDDKILAPTKLVGKAIENLIKDGVEGPLLRKYKEMGIVKDRVEQLALLVEDFTLQGTETVADLASRSASAFSKFKRLAAQAAETGEKWTGNKFVEEANRFIAANVMDQITSLAIKHGVMDAKTAQTYINTFVNRVEGSILASQRPLVFQGPVGQAVGLFQRYQFHLMQQLFRYVSEGSKKDAAMLLGLQSTIYGIQGLPAFQFINTHIIGTASGNTEHRDLYTYTYGVAGQTAGDFILYGLASNILQGNIYSRGDINPRHLTVLPTSLQDTPIVAGWGKFLLNIKETFSKLRTGGDPWETVLQGLEHNGISRPLAGMAQVMQAAGEGGQVYSTSKQGSILYSNDLLTWASMIRMIGGRPLDEARINDGMWRFKAYEAARRERIKDLSETVKTTLIQGNEPDSESLQRFAEQYAKLGGKQEHFNKWMLNLYKDANIPQAQQLEMSLKSPFAQQVQMLMGGDSPD